MRPVSMLFLCVGAIFFTAGCSRKDSPNSTQETQVQSPASAQARTENAGLADSFRESLPHVGTVDGYVGSLVCQSCHADEYKSWHRSYHRTMTQVASDESVQADFNDVTLTNETTRFRLNRKGGEFWVHMEPINVVNREPGTPTGLDVRLGLLTGSHNMQVFWLPEGDGNLQLGFPFTWLIPEKRWVPRNSTFVRPPDLVHHSEIWNVVCSRCHTTGVEPHADIRARRVETRVAELGISCEACHGPGERHVALRRQAESTAGNSKLEPGEIVHPRKIPAERSAQICGFCHSMKWIDRGENWTMDGFRYRPGDDLEKTTPIIRGSGGPKSPELADYLARHPDILEDFFWPDGMVKVSGRDYNGLIESPCYKGGQFSCLSCHSMHESEPSRQLAEKALGNGACIQCHDSFKDSRALLAHTHHQETSSGSSCYNCHMPHTTYGVLKAIRSHQISNPRVSDDLSTGRPNACNLCHLDKSLQWTAERLNTWYGQEIPALPAGRSNMSEALRLALAGDAGQRVLAAWHFSWPEALQVSGTNWVIPALGQLLDDPYAAVRCVAERSLRSISDFVPPEYFYPEDPRGRAPAREAVWKAWQTNAQRAEPEMTRNGANRAVLAHPEDLNAQRLAYEEFLRLRDDRTVRLRE